MSDPDLEARPSRRLWTLAAFAALALHVGGAALAIAHLRTDDPDDDLGAPAIEIGLEMAAPKSEATDLPPGPDSDASVASPAVPEQQAEVEETELPKAVPTETEEPDRVVTTSEPKEPEKEEPEKAKMQTQASTESIASEATAAPSSPAVPEAPRSVAPAPGTGEAARRQRVTWTKQLVAHLDRHKRYPANRVQKTAEIVVSFQLDRTGHVISTGIVRGSGDAAFDEAALAMLKRSDPVPQPPPLIADDGLNFTLPVIFRVKGKS